MKYLEYLKAKGEIIGNAAKLMNKEALDVITYYSLYYKRPEPISEFLLETMVEKWQKVYKDPEDGGCWFCHTSSGDLIFDTEYDTNLHKQCLELKLKNDPENPEAESMKYLLEEEE